MFLIPPRGSEISFSSQYLMNMAMKNGLHRSKLIVITLSYCSIIEKDENFRMELKKYVEMKDEVRSANLESKEIEENKKYDPAVRRLLRNFKNDSELKKKRIFRKIEEWKNNTR